MPYLLGIDLGTSSVKAVVIDQHGRVRATATQEYPTYSPQPGWAEQDPQEWWRAATLAVRAAVEESGGPVVAIGLSGQMHGPVLVDPAHQPVGRAIIWADQRSAVEVAEIEDKVGRERLARIAGTAPAAGFMGPTLCWLYKHQPARLDQTYRVLLPKDYVRLLLTGNIATEATDASATAMFDIHKRQWSGEICDIIQIPDRLLPEIIEPAAVAGTLTADAAAAIDLPAGLPVVAGCADQVAQAIGNGLLNSGNGSITIGSGGQVFFPLDAPLVDQQLRFHIFCHAPPQRWYLLGAMLTAGLSLRWLRDLLGMADVADAYRQLELAAAQVPPGADGLIFLPYLAGERSPVMDPRARGCFVGLTLRHDRAHLTRAIMEGVAFALRHILDSIREMGLSVDTLLAVGNGLASPVWRQIVADVVQIPLYLPSGREHAGSGAAQLAGIGAGLFGGYAEVGEIPAPPQNATEPNADNAALYADQFARYLQLYPALKSTFPP